tara:strand:- start:248 stop:1108 length:861 start_codon:yes stop_codon:yes gene_type:complete
MKNYIAKDIKNLWSFSKYYKHYNDVSWDWRNLPFTDNIDKIDSFHFEVKKNFKNISILEIGSSMGQGYDFLKKKSNIDSSNYLGLDVSSVAYKYCLEKYPETKWLNTNFSKYDLDNKFDYTFERHSLHHMPYPLLQFEKVFKNTNIAFTSTFRGCIHGPTISNLDLAFFENETGKYFMNIINFSEIILIALKNNFNDIVVDWRGLHENINSKISDQTEMYVSNEIDREKYLISRFIIFFRKNPNLKKVKVRLKKKTFYSFKNLAIINSLTKQISRIEHMYNFKEGL